MSLETAEIIYKIFLYSCLVSFIIYIPRIAYYFEGFRNPKQLENPEKNKLAVLVPARNEKGVVHLLDSLARQTYDPKYFDTYVIVADKNDPTIELCKNYKNTVCKLVENQTCKGDALDGVLQDILKSKKKYAGYIIVDADNIVDKDFVLEFNNSLVTGRDIILGKRCIKNFLFDRKYRNWVVNCNGLIYTQLDKLGNAFRSKNMMHASICGTGIMITAKVIDELHGWPFRFITEDFELAISSLIAERTFYYYEKAITYTEESMTHKTANDRRRRWLLGYAQVTSKYRKAVAEKYREDKIRLNDSKNLSPEEYAKLRGNFWGCFDFLYSFIPLGIFFAPAAICCLIFLIAGFISYRNVGAFDVNVMNLIYKGINCAFSMYLVLDAYTLFSLIADRKTYKITFLEKLWVMIINPFYISEYVGFFFWSFYKLAKGTQDTTWVSIDRIDDQENNSKKSAVRISHRKTRK